MNLRLAMAPAARSSVKVAAELVDKLVHPARGITILIYHRVGEAAGQMTLPPATFDSQMRWLATTQRVIPLDVAIDELDGTSGVEPGVVLTFDDGTVDWVDHVLPTLDRHGLPATFYVATSFVENCVEFPGGGRPLSWGGVRELASSGLAAIGSHTHSHMLLDRLDPSKLDDELDRSIGLLGERAGVDAVHFAYPKAVAGSTAAEAAVRRRFGSAVLAGTRANLAGADRYRLNRSPVQRADSDHWFRGKVTGGMHAEDDMRRALNRLRYRSLDS